MPYPILLIERTDELGRDPVASDFSLEERRQLRVTVASCIADCEKAGNIPQADYLRRQWSACVGLGGPPRSDVAQDVADRWTLFTCAHEGKSVPPEVAARNPKYMEAAALKPYLQVFGGEQSANEMERTAASIDGSHTLDLLPITPEEVRAHVRRALGLDEDPLV